MNTSNDSAPAFHDSSAPTDSAPGLTPERNDAPEAAQGDTGGEAPALQSVDDVFTEVANFDALGLRNSVLKGLKAAGFERPTRIQAMLIPRIMAGKDVMGQAKTGTGKTAAFALPLLNNLQKDVPSQALILVPTRELAMQVAREINELGALTPIRAVAVIGGERIQTQLQVLKTGPQIIVSTPGRLMDMAQRGHISLTNVKHAVLDEVDRMLDIGFREDIKKILGMCPQPPERQTIFVSATFSPEIERLIQRHSNNPEKIVAVTAGALTTKLVRQHYLAVQPWDKKKLLAHLLTHEEGALTLVFCRMKRTVDELTKYLNEKGIDAHSMHGDMYQTKRNKIIERLHKGDLSVLVASDLASRGLDVDGITHVINYDMPEDPEIYVHRIGRTARIGREGVAWSFVTPEQGELLTQIEFLINMEIPKLDYPDFVATPPPGGVARYAVPNSQEPKPVVENAVSRYAATMPPAPVLSKAEIDAQKFPGGIVPTKMPGKRMYGKVKGR